MLPLFFCLFCLFVYFRFLCQTSSFLANCALVFPFMDFWFHMWLGLHVGTRLNFHSLLSWSAYLPDPLSDWIFIHAPACQLGLSDSRSICFTCPLSRWSVHLSVAFLPWHDCVTACLSVALPPCLLGRLSLSPVAALWCSRLHWPLHLPTTFLHGSIPPPAGGLLNRWNLKAQKIKNSRLEHLLDTQLITQV